jgi:hypothetical protein
VKRILIITFLFLSFSPLWGQRENFRSRSTLGIKGGGSYYIGDLNQYHHFRRTNISAGLIYRYYVNSRIELRLSYNYGKIAGNDADSNYEYQRLRNLSFESDIHELVGGIEFNYLNYKIGDGKYFFTPYMFIEAGAFRMNPKREYQGEMIELQPLGTEGQGSALNDKDPYSLTQFVIPMGVGVKMNVGKTMAISLEYGIRKTFTDHLDDVGGDYVDPVLLTQANGNLATRMSDPSLGGFEAIGPRGNSSTNDWYSMFGLMITFKLGKEGSCYYK